MQQIKHWLSLRKAVIFVIADLSLTYIGEFGVLPWLFILLPLRKSVFSPAVQGISMMKINTRNGILP